MNAGLPYSPPWVTGGGWKLDSCSASALPLGGQPRFLLALPCSLQPAGENAGAPVSCLGVLEVRRRRQRSAPGRCQLPPSQALQAASVRRQAAEEEGVLRASCKLSTPRNSAG